MQATRRFSDEVHKVFDSGDYRCSGGHLQQQQGQRIRDTLCPLFFACYNILITFAARG